MTIRVLIVEDSPHDAFLLNRELQRGGFEASCERVDSFEGMRAALNQDWDIIFADYSMPAFTGLEALDLLNKSGKDIPMIIVSGAISEDAAIQAMKAGAVDYIYKKNMARLGPAVEHCLRDAQSRKARWIAEAALKASEDRLSRFAENASDIITIMTVTPEQRFIYVSPSIVSVTGYTPQECYADPNLLVRIIHPDDRQRVIDMVQNNQLLQNAFETRLFRKDGKMTWVEQRFTYVYDKNEQIQLIEGISREIIERKRYQAQLENVAWISAEVGKTLVTDEIFDTVYEGINRLFEDVSGLFISHYEADIQMIRCLYARADGQLISPDLAPLLPMGPPGEGTQSEVIRKRKPMIINNLMKHLRNPTVFGEGRDAQSAIYTPLQIQGEVYGVLQVQSYQNEYFRPSDANLLALVGNTMAIALENSRLLSDFKDANQRLTMAYDTTLEGWAKALEMRDQETEGHSQRVALYTLWLAHAVGIQEKDFIHIRRGALLHDIGKMGIPDSILLKAGPLTTDEWEIMRRHPIYAYNLLSQIDYLKQAMDIPYCHHEKWDGSGYPRGLKGEEIPLSARVFAVIDVWDALSSDRPYRQAWAADQVISYLKEQSGRHFDPFVLAAFFKIINTVLD